MRNKRGMFFLMVTIVIISLFILSLSYFPEFAARKSVQKRVDTLSNFVTTTESDLHRQIFISGYRVIFFMEKDIIDHGNYIGIGNTNSLAQEMFFNGTVNGGTQPLLQTFSEIEQSIVMRAARTNAFVNFSHPSIQLIQEDPWNVIVNFTSDFYVVDEGNLASWNKSLSIVVPIAISNFSDPIYLVGTLGEVAPVFAQTPYTTFDVANLEDHIAGVYYRNNTAAPSFLGRLEGNLTGSLYGVESLVNVPDIPAAYQTGRSITDYIYFEGTDTGCHLSGMDSWVRLDNTHRVIYGNIACG